MVTKGERRGENGEDKLEVWDKHITLLYVREITNKDLLHSTGRYTQYIVITHKGKESENTHTHTHTHTHTYTYN